MSYWFDSLFANLERVFIMTVCKSVRTRAVILDDVNRALVMLREKNGKKIILLPGGGVDEDELIFGALRREIEEETGLELKTRS